MSKNGKFKRDELRRRAFERLAIIIQHLSEEGDDVHTGLLDDPLIPNVYVEAGSSKSALLDGTPRRREHVVPRLMLANQALKMYQSNKSVKEVADMLESNLKFVWVTRDEAGLLDSKAHGLKTEMPPNWKFGDDPFARLTAVGIDWERHSTES